MPGKTLMGVDLGTSSLKAIILDQDGRLLSSAAREYAFDMPHPGWAEQDPHTWTAAALSAMQEAVAAADLASRPVEAIGLSGQMHGTVCVDAAGSPVRPAILWADQRSASQVQRVYQTLGVKRLGEWTANPLAAGFMLASWLWLLDNEPDTVRRTRSLLLPKDALRFALTGQLGVEMSDASSTLLFDTVKRGWSRELAQALGVNPGLLLPPHEAVETAGGLTIETARAVGLRAGTPVIYGGSDQGMALLGQGVVQPGQLLCSVSTGGQLVAPLGSPIYDAQLRTHTFCHVLKDRWYLMAATLSAGLSLRWLRDNLFMGMSYSQLAGLAEQAGTSDGLFFLPHLAGERTPYMDAASKAGFWGLTLHHNQGQLVRAVMEGVIFSMRVCLDLLVELGAPVERVTASGGGTRHPLWLRLIADIFDRPIYQTQASEASATGAAMLAGVNSGVYPDAETACRHVVRPFDEVIYPNPAAVMDYREAYKTFVSLYPVFRQLGSAGGGR